MSWEVGRLPREDRVCERCLRTIGHDEGSELIKGKTVCSECAPGYHQELSDYYSWEAQVLAHNS